MLSVGMTGFEPATTRPPDAYSNRAELHPVFLLTGAKVEIYSKFQNFPDKNPSPPGFVPFYMLIDTYISYLSQEGKVNNIPFVFLVVPHQLIKLVIVLTSEEKRPDNTFSGNKLPD
mgnify:CR=1 FL=1